VASTASEDTARVQVPKKARKGKRQAQQELDVEEDDDADEADDEQQEDTVKGGKRVKRSKSHTFSYIKMKLDSFLAKPSNNQELAQALRAVKNLFDGLSNIATKLKNEGGMLALLHVTRCLEENLPLPELDEQFFRHCILVATKDPSEPSDDPEFLKTFREFRQSLQPDERRFTPDCFGAEAGYFYERVDSRNLSNLIQDIAKSMVTETKNFYVATTVKFFGRYVHFKFGIPNNEINKWLFNLKKKGPDDQDVQATCTENIEELHEFFEEFMSRFNPFFDGDIKRNLNYFVPLFYKILTFLEARLKAAPAPVPEEPQAGKGRGRRPKDERNEYLRGNKLFTILPSPNNSIPIHFLIDRSYLQQFLTRLDHHHTKVILKEIHRRLDDKIRSNQNSWHRAKGKQESIEKLRVEKDELEKLRVLLKHELRKPYPNINNEKVSRNDVYRALLWSIIFNWKSFNFHPWKFDFAVQTDAVSVSVRISKAKPVVAPSTNKTKKQKRQEERLLQVAHVQSLYKERQDAVRLVSLDPGKTFIGTSYCPDITVPNSAKPKSKSTESLKPGADSGYPPSAGRARLPTNSHNVPRGGIRQDPADEEAKCRFNHSFAQQSTKNYLHQRKTPEYRAWLKRRYKRVDNLEQKKNSMNSSTKTTNLSELRKAIRYRLKWGDFVQKHESESAARNWKFKLHRYGEKALSNAARKLTFNSKSPKDTIVGFGDWSQPQGFKGGVTAPIKKLARKMVTDRRATVVLVDEYRTSKTCSSCEKMNFESVKFRDKKERSQGAKKKRSQARKEKLNAHTEKQQAGEGPNISATVSSVAPEVLHPTVASTSASSSAASGDEERKLYKSHQVIRCQTCRMCWQRDINAARNIHKLLSCLVRGEERPKAFRRQKEEGT